MPSNKMRLFRSQHRDWTEEQIEEERQRRIHHVGLSQEEVCKMRGWTSLPNQEKLF